jgi:hypothetical protein
MKLSPRRAERASRSTEYCARLSVGWRIWWTRKPLQRVLQNSGKRKIVLRNCKDQRVCPGDLRPKLLDGVMLVDMYLERIQCGSVSTRETVETAMAGLDVNTTTISVEHVTIPSQKPFESVKAALERLVPRIDDGISCCFATLKQSAPTWSWNKHRLYPSSVSGIMVRCSKSMDCSKKRSNTILAIR